MPGRRLRQTGDDVVADGSDRGADVGVREP